MRRRDFIAGIGAAAGLPQSARAQQGVPVVGYLNLATPDVYPQFRAGFRDGLKEAGFVVGDSLRIEERWAEGESERLPALAADLVARRVSLIAALGSGSAPLAAKAATSTIPILFMVGSDPVQLGLVASLNRPGGNITGVTVRIIALIAKRLELLHEMLPNAELLAVFIDPSLVSSDIETTQVDAAAQRLGVRLLVLKAGSVDEMTASFPTLVEQKVGGVVIGNGPRLNAHAEQTAVAAARSALPTIADLREYAVAGGLIGYGANFVAGFHAVGLYAARILKGEKPADLPVQQADRFDLVINLRTAKTLGLTVPPAVLAQATEVIE
jgi:putative tryptophan/tyrosine transport system substrate-binding protein